MSKEITRRKFITQATSTLGIASLLTPRILFAQEKDVNFDNVRNNIKKAVTAGLPPSLAVAVAKDGKIIWEEAFGWANREKRIPATVDTRYAIASVSKPLTALGVMVLVERGLIKLDDSVSKFLGNIKLTANEEDAATVTIKHLLQHTSGLPRHWRNFYSDESEVPPKLAETISRYGILVNAPGTQHLYTNLGYGLLAYIIEQVSRMPFSEFMRKDVFQPLGMTNTSIENESRIFRPAANLYASDGAAIPYYVSDESGAMSATSSVHDIIKFGMFHLKETSPGQRQIIKSETIDLMAQNKFITGTEGGIQSTDWFYSLGWVGREKSQYSYYNLAHSGDAPGVSALLVILPTERIAIATIANARFVDLIYTVADDVLDSLLPDNKKMREADPSAKPLSNTQFKPTEELLGNWAGEIKTYSGIIPITMKFQTDGDVHVKLEGQLQTILSNITYENKKITGRCHGTITTPDAMRKPHQLRFVLNHKGSELSGTVHAQSSVGAVAKGTPGRDYFALASWVKLNKKV
jgi:CubicO group peptidase (beta-lactamase class C family)